MLKRLITLQVVMAICTGAVWAGDIEDAWAATDKKDYATAALKYKSAAAINSNSAVEIFQQAYARTQLGKLYKEGLGVPQNVAEAVRLWKLASAQGNENAQINLAFMYANGSGVKQNFVLAYMWNELAVQRDEPKSLTNRDAYAAYMTPQQIAEAQKLAKECRARNFKKCD